MSAIINLPSSIKRIDIYKQKQEDPTCCEITKSCQQRWPSKHETTLHMKPYWVVRNALTVNQGLLMYNCRIAVSVSLQKETFGKIHQGHQGIDREVQTIGSKFSMVAWSLQRYP